MCITFCGTKRYEYTWYEGVEKDVSNVLEKNVT